MSAPLRPDNLRGLTFTLVELLVVSAILAILVSLISPALRNAFNFAESAACKKNLSSLGVAHELYREDYSDFIPPNIPNPANNNKSALWFLHNYGYINAKPVTNMDISQVPENAILRCPSGLADIWRSEGTSESDPNTLRPWIGTNGSAVNDVRPWYWISGPTSPPTPTDVRNLSIYSWYTVHVGPFTPNFLFDSTKPSWPGYKKWPRYSDIRRPSRTVNLYDGNMPMNPVQYRSNGTVEGKMYRLSARHNNYRFCNILMFDGSVMHLERFEMREYIWHINDQ